MDDQTKLADVQHVPWPKVLSGFGWQVLAGDEFEDIAGRIREVITAGAHPFALELVFSLAFQQRGSGSQPSFGLLPLIEWDGEGEVIEQRRLSGSAKG